MILSSDITGGFVSFRFFSPISLLSNTIYISDESDLLLWDDDLGGEPVLGVGDGMVQQADAPHHLPGLLHLVPAAHNTRHTAQRAPHFT